MNDPLETGNEIIDKLVEESALLGSRRAHRYPGHKFYGYFCSYWPEELVLAAGLEPLRLLPSAGGATPAELPAFCCSLARGTLAMGLKNSYSDLAGVGFAHTCDTMQCLSGIWGHSIGEAGTLVMVPPVLLKAPGAMKYYRAELKELQNKLGEISGTYPGGENLERAVQLCQRIRRLSAELDDLRPMLPSPLVSAINRAGQLMPRQEYADSLEEALPALRQMSADPGPRARLLVSGPVLENDSLFSMIEALGGRVVADDTCTGQHHYTGPLTTNSQDPLDAIVRRYSEMAPCPCRHKTLEARTDYLSALARQRQVQGAILAIRKYCDPHAWDAVPVTRRFKEEGIRTLVLELEGPEVGGQERTRVQAFLESL